MVPGPERTGIAITGGGQGRLNTAKRPVTRGAAADHPMEADAADARRLPGILPGTGLPLPATAGKLPAGI